MTVNSKKILITGAAGYIGFQLGERLCREYAVVGVDIRSRADAHFHIETMDIRSHRLAQFMADENVTHVVHLASIVEPSRDVSRDYDIDVNGTRNLLEACVKNNVQHLTVTSSGAAYGYHADNPAWLKESDPLRGNDEFSYAAHKRIVETILARYREHYPALQQLVFRPGTVLGANTDNMITQLFNGRRLLTISGSESPFVFIWDQDVVGAIEKGLREDKTGIYNLAGDGALTMRDIAALINKPVMNLPAGLLRWLLRIGKLLKLTRYGPDQINFLRYRPVLSNQALKDTFGYCLNKTSRETFEFFLAHRATDMGEKS